MKWWSNHFTPDVIHTDKLLNPFEAHTVHLSLDSLPLSLSLTVVLPNYNTTLHLQPFRAYTKVSIQDTHNTNIGASNLVEPSHLQLSPLKLTQIIMSQIACYSIYIPLQHYDLAVPHHFTIKCPLQPPSTFYCH